MNILIAPNAFKNSLDAASVATAFHKGLQASRLSCICEIFPVGDGGDGTGELLIHHLNGKIIQAEVHDPLGTKIESSFGLIENTQTAVIEMANASGLRLLQPGEYNPMQASSFGTGELIKAALDKKVKKIILCIGGSATVDGAAGIMQALGIKFKDGFGKILQVAPSSFTKLAAIDVDDIDERIGATELIVLCDVDNKLLGESGAASVFAPQKGASVNEVKLLDEGLTQLRKIVFEKTGKDMAAIKHGGAAGGVAAGLYAMFNATLENGIDYFLQASNFDGALQNTDLVITGEGSIDEQTLQGKAPFGVAQKAKDKNIPVVGIAGCIPLITDVQLQNYFDVLLPISHKVMDIQTAINDTYENVVRTGKLLGDLLYIRGK